MPDSFERHTDAHVPDIPRPEPSRQLSDLARAWFAWFGVARMLSLGITVVLVGAGGYWLLNAPPPPVEASLPFAATRTTVITSAAGAVSGGIDASGRTAAVDEALMTGSTTPPTTVPGPVFVHVAGAVLAPGVFELLSDARVVDAIEAALGAAPEAALDGVNLAAPIADGQRIYVPRVGEVDPVTVDNGPRADMSDLAPDEPSGGPIDLNRATTDELDTLPGVGPSTAAAIVDDRDRNGPFPTVDDLDRVAGIGPAKLDALRDLVTV